MKRTYAPIFWLLFGAGGMLAALFGPALVVITGLGSHGDPAAMDYATALSFARHPLGKLILLAVIALFAWHGAERVYLTLHDMHVAPKRLLARLCYGGGAVVTVVALLAVVAVGF